MRSPNCSSPSCRATTTKKASEASFPTTSPVDRASVPNAIRCDADPSGFRSGLIGGATLGDSPYGPKPGPWYRRGVTTTRLDFLGIGAPKAATTSLHHYMRTHPELYLPEAKEQPFFTVDAAFEEGWDAFAAVAFHGAPSGRRYGKITPHYMGGPVAWRDATRGGGRAGESW